MAMTEAWVDPHGDGPAITGVTQDIHHAGGAQIRKDIVLQHYFQRIVPEHIGRETNDRWIVAFRVPGLQGAQYFIARHRVNPDARRRHFAQNFGRRARLHCKSCLHARCARDELDVRYPLPQQGSDPLHTRAHANGEELHQLRPYRAGDPPRSIAWKHSARRDTLLVREYEKPIGIEVVLDWRALAPLGQEARIARLARWVDSAEREGRRYTLLLPMHPPIGPGQGASHHHLCLRALALLPHD